MANARDFLNKNGMFIILGLFLILFLRTCSITGEQSSMRKEIKNLDTSLRKEIKVEGLKASKRTLYDWNSVIRTVVRPDDLMNKYDQEINQLSK